METCPKCKQTKGEFVGTDKEEIKVYECTNCGEVFKKGLYPHTINEGRKC